MEGPSLYPMIPRGCRAENEDQRGEFFSKKDDATHHLEVVVPVPEVVIVVIACKENARISIFNGRTQLKI